MKENKKEEIQSRREFFKSAAKKALPILGAIVLSNFPNIAEASKIQGKSNTDSNASWCSWCSYGCGDGCTSCVGTCVSCIGSCVGTCTSCTGSCYSSCWGGVYY